MVPWGVRVSIIEAGAHRTPILVPSVLETKIRGLWDALPDDQKKEYGESYLQKGRQKSVHVCVCFCVHVLNNFFPRARRATSQYPMRPKAE